MKKLLALFLCLCLLAAPAFASGDASAETASAEASGESASGEASFDATGNGALSTSAGEPAILVQGGEILCDEDAEINLADGGILSADAVSGASIALTDPDAGGVAWLNDGGFLLGGEEDFHTVETVFSGEELSFNTVIALDLPEDFAFGVDSSSGFAIEAGGTGTMTVENVYARTTGVNRYSVHLSSGNTIIKDSYFESLGCKGEYTFMPWFTMQYGSSRNLVMTSQSNVYVYNSFCATDGFASWSTDMTRGAMFLYNANCINYNGGYGTYADGCVVSVYCSSFDSAEFGMFGCNGGTLIVGSSDDAIDADDPVFLENLVGEELADAPSVILGDRNAVVMHVVSTFSSGDPEHNGIVDTNTASDYRTQNRLYAKNSVFSTVGATGTSAGRFPAPLAMYLDHMRGSVIEFRSSNADVRLENCELQSANGILFQSVVNLDSSAVQILDDIPTESIPGICIESVGNDWTGDVSHEDYQRPMYLTLADTTLTGAILAPGIDEWLAMWEDYADVHYSVDPDTGLYVNDDDPTDTGDTYVGKDPNSVYLWATGVTEYDAVRGVYLTMDAGSVWNVTGESSLRGLTVEAGAVINGTVAVDGVLIDVSAGGSWTGDIVVTPAAASGEASGGAS